MRKHLRIRRLRDLNAMEDIPDQDSARNPGNTSNFILFARAILGLVLQYLKSTLSTSGVVHHPSSIVLGKFSAPEGTHQKMAAELYTE